MTRPAQPESPDRSNLDAALGDYMRRVDSGKPFDREAFLAEYPDLENELRSYFATVDQVEQMAGPRVVAAEGEEMKTASDTAPASQGEQETLPPAEKVGLNGTQDSPRESDSGMFGRYRIVKTLGKGGMGAVYLAEDPELDRLVAIKVPFVDKDDQGSILDRFRREAKSVAAIQHPNICPIYDVGDLEGVPFMAMAYLEGKPLSKLIQPDKPLPIRPVLMLVRKLALALEQAHKAGVIHRDLKPDNVMINKLQEPVIMDFGLARREGKADTSLTKAGALMGTPQYMPPEQVSGDLEAMGPGCDIYSLGVILYQLLTGRVPFAGDVLAVLSQIALDKPKPPSTFRPGIDEPLDRICLKAMSKKVEDRFGSMGEFAKHLTAYVKSSGPQKSADAKSAAEGTNETDELFGEPAAVEGGAKSVERPEPQPPPLAQPAALPKQKPIQPPARSRPRWTIPSWQRAAVGGGLVGLLLVACAAIVFLSTGRGRVKIEIDDPTVTVFVDGEETKIEGLGDPIRLRVGEHTLVVKRGDVQVETHKFQIVRGETTPLKITLLEDDAVASSTPVSPPTTPPDRQDRDWRTIFYGGDLSGWTVMEPVLDFSIARKPRSELELIQLTPTADFRGWELRDELMIFEGLEGRVLAYDEVLKDFEVSMEVRLTPGAYFQFMFRALLSEGRQGRVQGFLQTRLHDEKVNRKQPLNWQSGGLFNIVPPLVSAVRPLGEWNTLVVRSEADRVQIVLNEARTADVKLSSVLPAEQLSAVPQSGLIGFYSYETSKGVAVRNIRLRELTPLENAK